MSNSPLVDVTILSPNNSGYRTHKIDTITIHHMAGNMTVEACGNMFANPNKKVSSNYGIGSDGRIGLYVEESKRSWCSSNASNDQRAITIEVANSNGAPDWEISTKALDSLVALLVDICKRNNIKELKWKGDKNLIGQVDKQNMTVHRWFASTLCPGPYLYENMGVIASRVNSILKEENFMNVSIELGPMPDEDAELVLAYLMSAKVESVVIEDTKINVGDKVCVLDNETYDGRTFNVYYAAYDVLEISGDRVVIGVNGVTTCAINIKNIKKIKVVKK